MTRRVIDIRIESFPLIKPFKIARAVRTAAEVVTVSITEDGVTGRGEGRPTERYDETPESAAAAVRGIASELAQGLERDALQQSIRPSAARNAVDCALWDLEAKLKGTDVWTLTGRSRPETVATAYALGIDAPEAMARAAEEKADWPLIKIKLAGDGLDANRLAAIRTALPEATLVVDANEGLTPASMPAVLDAARQHGVAMVEQPLKESDDDALSSMHHPVPICADEACRTVDDLARLEGRYDMVNIKLDKTGGLTGALDLEAAAREKGFGIMVGCMVSTSLGLAPAQIVAASADYVDLDAAMYLSEDRPGGLTYTAGRMTVAGPALWGA